jgi:excisionase family DNA binding protein
MALHELAPSPMPGSIEPLLDIPRAAQLLGISPKTSRDWIQARRIEYVKVGTRVMIRPETIRQFVTENTRRAAG